jgi:hypothetical protein
LSWAKKQQEQRLAFQCAKKVKCCIKQCKSLTTMDKWDERKEKNVDEEQLWMC